MTNKELDSSHLAGAQGDATIPLDGGIGVGSSRKIAPLAGRADTAAASSSVSGNKLPGSIQVAIRARPMSQYELKGGHHVTLTMQGNACWVEGQDKPFGFDHCFWSVDEKGGNGNKISNKDVYDKLGRDVFCHALNQYNSTLLAYGQTGAGKSHSVLGTDEDENRGIVPRVLVDLFQEKEKDPTLSLEISILQIYKEQITDLLPYIPPAPKGASKKIHAKNYLRNHPSPRMMVLSDSDASPVQIGTKKSNNGPQVFLMRHAIGSLAQFKTKLQDACNRRAVGSHKLNSESSRGHMVVTIYLNKSSIGTAKSDIGSSQEVKGTKTLACINLVDLAGSENLKKAGGNKQSQEEAVMINKSLSALKGVMEALVERTTKNPKQKIPFKDSQLTRVLRPSLDGNAIVQVIAAISPSSSNLSETVNTLRFASQIKSIRISPTQVKPDAITSTVEKKTVIKNEQAEIESRIEFLRQAALKDKAQIASLETRLKQLEKMQAQLTITPEQQALIDAEDMRRRQEAEDRKCEEAREAQYQANKSTLPHFLLLTNFIGASERETTIFFPPQLTITIDSSEPSPSSISERRNDSESLVRLPLDSSVADLRAECVSLSGYLSLRALKGKVLVQGTEFKGSRKLAHNEGVLLGARWYRVVYPRLYKPADARFDYQHFEGLRIELQAASRLGALPINVEPAVRQRFENFLELIKKANATFEAHQVVFEEHFTMIAGGKIDPDAPLRALVRGIKNGVNTTYEWSYPYLQQRLNWMDTISDLDASTTNDAEMDLDDHPLTLNRFDPRPCPVPLPPVLIGTVTVRLNDLFFTDKPLPQFREVEQQLTVIAPINDYGSSSIAPPEIIGTLRASFCLTGDFSAREPCSVNSTLKTSLSSTKAEGFSGSSISQPRSSTAKFSPVITTTTAAADSGDEYEDDPEWDDDYADETFSNFEELSPDHAARVERFMTPSAAVKEEQITGVFSSTLSPDSSSSTVYGSALTVQFGRFNLVSDSELVKKHGLRRIFVAFRPPACARWRNELISDIVERPMRNMHAKFQSIIWNCRKQIPFNRAVGAASMREQVVTFNVWAEQIPPPKPVPTQFDNLQNAHMQDLANVLADFRHYFTDPYLGADAMRESVELVDASQLMSQLSEEFDHVSKRISQDIGAWEAEYTRLAEETDRWRAHHLSEIEKQAREQLAHHAREIEERGIRDENVGLRNSLQSYQQANQQAETRLQNLYNEFVAFLNGLNYAMNGVQTSQAPSSQPQDPNVNVHVHVTDAAETVRGSSASERSFNNSIGTSSVPFATQALFAPRDPKLTLQQEIDVNKNGDDTSVQSANNLSRQTINSIDHHLTRLTEQSSALLKVVKENARLRENAQISQLQKDLEEITLQHKVTNEELLQTQEKLAEAQPKLKRLKLLEDPMSTLNQLERQLLQKKAELNRSVTASKEITRHHALETARSASRIRQLETEMESLQQKLKEALTPASTQLQAELQNLNDELQARLQNLNVDLGEMQRQRDEAQATNTRLNNDLQIEAAKAQSLERSLANEQAQMLEQRDPSNAVPQLQSQLNELQSQLIELNRHLKSFQDGSAVSGLVVRTTITRTGKVADAGSIRESSESPSVNLFKKTCWACCCCSNVYEPARGVQVLPAPASLHAPEQQAMNI